MEPRTESQAHVPVYPMLLVELYEYNGNLHGFEQTARGYLTVHIGSSYFLLPVTMKARLEKLMGKWIAVTMIHKKYYLREMRGTPGGEHCLRQMPLSAPSEGDLLKAKVAELEAENARLRAGGAS